MTYHKGFYAMGTRLNAVLPNIDTNSGQHILNLIEKEVSRIEDRLSWFKYDSEVTWVNKRASKEEVKLSSELYEVLKMCQDYYTVTNGAFNISLRPLLTYWKTQRANLSGGNNFRKLLHNLNIQQITLNHDKRTVKFKNEDVVIDLGGFGKGYALEKINSLLQKLSVESAFISFGESSILTKGKHPKGDHWKIGLKNYYNPNESLHTFHVKDGSVSTSSNFYVDDKGTLKNHRHVINPFTGYPVDDTVTVSVSGGSSTVVEILSTAFLVLPDEEIKEIINGMDDLRAVKIIYSTDKPEVSFFGSEKIF